MTICITCGHSTENCFCGEEIGGHPPEQRSAGWEERKMAFDTARDYFEEIKANRATIAELQTENKRLKAERDRFAAENELLKKKREQQQTLKAPSPFSLHRTSTTTATTIERLSNSSVYRPPQRSESTNNRSGSCLVTRGNLPSNSNKTFKRVEKLTQFR